MFNIFKKIFCGHVYKSLGWWEESDGYKRYSMHRIKCIKCGQEKDITGNEWHFILKDNQKVY